MKQGREIGLERFEAIIAQMRKKIATEKQKALVDDLDQIRVLYSILLDDNVILRAIVIDFYEATWDNVDKEKLKKIYSRLEDRYNEELKQIK